MAQFITITPPVPPVNSQLAVAAWLHENSVSPLTHGAYDAELRRFRAELQQVDLDGDYGLIALVAQAYAAASGVGAVTHNKRFSCGVEGLRDYALPASGWLPEGGCASWPACAGRTSTC